MDGVVRCFTILDCLASATRTRWNRADHAQLRAAGLGAKHVYSEDVEAVTSADLRDPLYREFPKLAGEGFEILRLLINSMELENIALPSSGHTPLQLSHELKSAKIFVRPIVHDLSLAPVAEVKLAWIALY